MLILSRYTDEIIRIGKDIEVLVVEVRGDRVRLGITAPPDVKVLRTELLDKINEKSSCHNNGNQRHDFRNRRRQ